MHSLQENKENNGGLPPISKEQVQWFWSSVSKERSPVFVGYGIYCLSNIDGSGQTFFVDFKLKVRWRDPNLVNDADFVSLKKTGKFPNGDVTFRRINGNFPDFVVKMIDPDDVPISKPKIEFGNCLDSAVYEDGSEIFFMSPNDEPGWIRWEKRYTGIFSQELKLEHFPWDNQALRIRIRMPNKSDRYRYFKAEPESKRKMKQWVTLAEWDIYQSKVDLSMTKDGKGEYTIIIPTLRKSGYYVRDVMMVTTGICLLSFSAFAMPVTDLADRMSVLLTVLLTAIAFKLVISDSLPKISYWTELDVYMNFNFFLLFVISVENTLIAGLEKLYSEDLLTFVDNIILIFLVVAYILFHIWFIRQVNRIKGLSQENLSKSRTRIKTKNETMGHSSRMGLLSIES